MKPAFRTVAALLALIAFSLFQVEGLWAASACSPDMEMPAASHVAEAGSHSDGGSMDGSGHSHERDGKGQQSPACPLMPAGPTSCAGGVALLPSSGAPDLGTAEDELSIASSDHAKDLLLAVSLLRPPRA